MPVAIDYRSISSCILRYQDKAFSVRNLAFATLRILVLVSKLLVHLLSRSSITLCELRYLQSAGGDPQEVVHLELIDLVEETVEAVK